MKGDFVSELSLPGSPCSDSWQPGCLQKPDTPLQDEALPLENQLDLTLVEGSGAAEARLSTGHLVRYLVLGGDRALGRMR